MQRPESPQPTDKELTDAISYGFWEDDVERLVEWYLFYRDFYRHRNQKELPFLDDAGVPEILCGGEELPPVEKEDGS